MSSPNVHVRFSASFRSSFKALATCALGAACSLVLLSARDARAQMEPTPTPKSPWPYDDSPMPGAPAPLPPSEPTDEPPPAPPEPASAAFGAKGQWVLGGGTNIGISSTQYDASAATYLSAGFSPNLDYFVVRNVSIGLDLGVSYSDSRSYGTDGSLVDAKTTNVFGGPRFGVNLPLGNAVSWWLTGTLGIESIHTTTSLASGSSLSTSSSTGAPDTSRAGPYVSLYLPLLVHPAPHFYMGFGPTVFHEFGALQGGPNIGDQQTTFGAAFVVGGYWGGEPTRTVPANATPRPLTHLGEKGEFVFTNELGASISSTAYAGTSSSELTGSVALGVDYFLVNHFAIGFGGGGGGGSWSGTDGNGNPETVNTSNYDVFTRATVHLPLTEHVSLLPRVALGLGGNSYSAASATGNPAYNETRRVAERVSSRSSSKSLLIPLPAAARRSRATCRARSPSRKCAWRSRRRTPPRPTGLASSSEAGLSPLWSALVRSRGEPAGLWLPTTPPRPQARSGATVFYAWPPRPSPASPPAPSSLPFAPAFGGADYAASTRLVLAATVLYVFLIHFVFIEVPTEKTMGIVQKIFYFHVPSAYSM